MFYYDTRKFLLILVSRLLSGDKGRSEIKLDNFVPFLYFSSVSGLKISFPALFTRTSTLPMLAEDICIHPFNLRDTCQIYPQLPIVHPKSLSSLIFYQLTHIFFFAPGGSCKNRIANVYFFFNR